MSDTIPNLTALIKELRDKTGLGIMACKKALLEVGGDVEKAYDELRKKGEKMAGDKASRSATEGKLAIEMGENDVAIVVVNCETDFVSKGEHFQSFADQVGKVAYENKITDLDALLAQSMGEGTVESERVALVSKVGENIQISAVHYHAQADGHVSVYSHGEKLACAVFLADKNQEVAKDIGMHVVAMNPVAISADDVPQDILEREKAVFASQTEKMGKPEFAQKIIDGKIAKYLKEVCLVDQSFVKDTTITIKDYLKTANTRVLHFIRVELS